MMVAMLLMGEKKRKVRARVRQSTRHRPRWTQRAGCASLSRRRRSSHWRAGLCVCVLVCKPSSAKGRSITTVKRAKLPDGGRYTGQINKQGNAQGQGTKYRADGSEEASGEWHNGELHGRGKMSLNGDSYEGDFVDGEMIGLGTYTYADGRVFEGEFHGSANGFGIQWNREGEIVKCGRWVDDELVEFCPVPHSKILVGAHLSAAGPSPAHPLRSAAPAPCAHCD